MRLSEIATELADLRDDLSRHYLLTGVEEDQATLADAVTHLVVARERVERLLRSTDAAGGLSMVG